MKSPIRVRFAPSPTGYLHIGSARSALFNWLFARHHNATFVLRVEDTDAARDTDEARKAIIDGLRWLGLNWDEGPEVGGPYGPYYQSQRGDIYQRYFEKLQQLGRVYEDEGCWRFAFERKPITLQDAVVGEITIDYRDSSNTPDMVIRRSDGSFVFHFVNVVDDIEMRITHVIRGEDHVMNTPKHIQLFEAFGAAVPVYAHIPLILNPDGSKMSKRSQGATLAQYIEEGFYAPAVNNFLALLGWSPKSEEEKFSVDELVSRFSLESVNRSPAKFDLTKCRWLNQQHLMALNAGEFAALAKPFVQRAGLQITHNFEAMAASVQTKVQVLDEVAAKIAFFVQEPLQTDPEALGKLKPGSAALVLEFLKVYQQLPHVSGVDCKQALQELAKNLQVKPGALMLPLRVALSGQSSGPDMEAIFDILSREQVERRLAAAASWQQ